MYTQQYYKLAEIGLLEIYFHLYITHEQLIVLNAILITIINKNNE